MSLFTDFIRHLILRIFIIETEWISGGGSRFSAHSTRFDLALVRRQSDVYGDGIRRVFLLTPTTYCTQDWRCPHTYSRRSHHIWKSKRNLWFSNLFARRFHVLCRALRLLGTHILFDTDSCWLQIHTSIFQHKCLRLAVDPCARFDKFRFVEFYTQFCHFDFMFTSPTHWDSFNQRQTLIGSSFRICINVLQF